MKIKPEQFAQTLIASAKPDNLKLLAENFWHILQKNKQYKDLLKILDALDIESVKQEGKVLAKVYSDKALSETEIKSISEKLNTICKKPTIIRNIVKSSVNGVEIVVDDQVIDLSLTGKIENLRKQINK